MLNQRSNQRLLQSLQVFVFKKQIWVYYRLQYLLIIFCSILCVNFLFGIVYVMPEQIMPNREITGQIFNEAKIA